MTESRIKGSPIELTKLPSGNFKPRFLYKGKIVPWLGSAPNKPAIIIQSAVKGGTSFEPAKLFQLQTLRNLSPNLVCVHSYAGPQAPKQIIDKQSENASVPFILSNIYEAIKQGWWGVVINDCMADPGLSQLEQLIGQLNADFRVIAPAKTSMIYLADKVGDFGIVGVASTVPIFEQLAIEYGLADNLRERIVVDETLVPANLHRIGLAKVAESLYEKITRIRQMGAQGIVFGCTTLGGTLDVLQRNYPVLKDYMMIEPMPLTLKVAAETVQKM